MPDLTPYLTLAFLVGSLNLLWAAYLSLEDVPINFSGMLGLWMAGGAFDLGMTVWLITNEGAREANPIYILVVDQGMPIFVLFGLSVTILMFVPLAYASRYLSARGRDPLKLVGGISLLRASCAILFHPRIWPLAWIMAGLGASLAITEIMKSDGTTGIRAKQEVLEELVSTLEELGYVIRNPRSLAGSSGVLHFFDVVAVRERSEPELVVLDVLTEEAGRDQVAIFFAKAYDSAPDAVQILVAFKLTKEARKLAREYWILVIEGMEPDAISRELRELLLIQELTVLLSDAALVELLRNSLMTRGGPPGNS